MQSTHPLLPSDVVAVKTSTYFVDHLWELFAPLLLGEPLSTTTGSATACPAHFVLLFF